MSDKSAIVSMRAEGRMAGGLQDMIAHINSISPTKDMRLIEIGAYAGESTAIFCQNFKAVVTIDPFLNGYDSGDSASHAAPFSQVYAVFCKRMQKYANYTLIQKTSDDAVKELMDQPVVHCFDVVYIDGMHRYEQVKKDILNYSKIVKIDGFITGHDYVSGWGEVVRAVNEFCVKPDMVFRDGSWLVRKVS